MPTVHRSALVGILGSLLVLAACTPGPVQRTDPVVAARGAVGGAGVADASVLRPSGSVTVTRDGAVVENLDITGGITVRANDVTIRNVRLKGTASTGVMQPDGYSGLVMDRIEIIGQFRDGQRVEADQGIYAPRGFTLRNSRISGYPDGAKVHHNSVIENNHFFGNQRTVDSRGRTKHTDGIQTSGGSNVVIRNNTFATDHRSDYDMGSNLMIQNEFGTVSNYLIENNRFSGGNYSTYFTDKQMGHGPHRNVVVRNNTWVRDTYRWGPVYFRGDNMDVTFTGNTFDDGTPYRR